MKNQTLLKKKFELFYNKIAKKRNMNEERRIQTDREFKQSKTKSAMY